MQVKCHDGILSNKYVQTGLVNIVNIKRGKICTKVTHAHFVEFTQYEYLYEITVDRVYQHTTLTKYNENFNPVVLRSHCIVRKNNITMTILN